MILPRREFLNLLGAATGAAGLGACGQYSVPDRLVERALRGPGLESRAQTICGLCGGGCGMTVRLVDGLPVGVKGNANHPLNRGGLCPVGNGALEVLYSTARVQQPLRRVEGGFEELGWEEALGEIGSHISRLIREGQGHRLAMLSGLSGALFHDLGRLFASAVGSSSVARLGSENTAPYRFTQGIDAVPGIDLSRADMVLSFGLDLFEDGPAPVHAISALIGSRATEERARVLYVGTRLSPTAAKADQFVCIRPGTAAAFALGVAHVLVREGRYDAEFVASKTFGFDDWSEGGQARPGFRRVLLERYYPDRVAQICGCGPDDVADVARRFGGASAPVAIAGGEVSEAENGSWNLLAVHSLNALVGAFDRSGGIMRPPTPPVTPLPTVPIEGRTESIFADDGWTPGDPVRSMLDRLEQDPDAVQVLLLADVDPVHDSPLGAEFEAALTRIPLVVSMTSFLDDTADAAHLVLPTPVFLEDWFESTPPAMTAFGTLGLAQPVIEPLYDTRHPGDVVLELARRTVPGDSLPWTNYQDYLKYRLRDLAASGEGAVVSGSFEESWRHFLEERGWRFLAHQRPEDFWRELGREGAWSSPVPPPGDWEQIFRTASGRYEFYSRELKRRLLEVGGSPGDGDEGLRRAVEKLQLTVEPDEACLPHYEPLRASGEGELLLIPFRPSTARSRYSPASPMVMEMFGYPVLTGWQVWAEVGPATARGLGVEAGDEVALSSDRGELEAVIRVQPGAAEGVVHVPLGLRRPAGPNDPAGASGNPLRLLLPARDSLSGHPALNSTRVGVRLVRKGTGGAWTHLETGEEA